MRRERTLAVIAGDRVAGGIHVILAAHLAADRTSPADCHSRAPSKIIDDWTDARIADEKRERLRKLGKSTDKSVCATSTHFLWHRSV